MAFLHVIAYEVVLHNLLSPLVTIWALFAWQIVESLTCDMLQTGVSQFATGGQVQVLEFDQAGQDWQPSVWKEPILEMKMK